MVCNFFVKKTYGSDVQSMSNECPSDLAMEQLAEELHKSIIRKFKERKVYSPFKDTSADLADMQIIRKFNKGFRFLLCGIDIFSKYDWAVPLKDKVTISKSFKRIELKTKQNMGRQRE